MATAHLPVPDPPQGRPSRFSHLVLQSPRFREMVAWYKTVLRAQPMFENEVVSFLTYDEEHHRVMIGSNPNAKPRDPEFLVRRHREGAPDAQLLLEETCR